MEHSFSIPNKSLNSLKFKDETGLDLFIREDVLFISGDCTKAQAEAALEAHDGSTTEATISEKSESVGLSIDDLKVALGL
jgi:hypothetical protein